MAIKNYELKYGKTIKKITLEEEKVLQVLESKEQEPIQDIKEAVQQA